MAGKTKQIKYSDKNFIEAAASDIASGVVTSVKDDLMEQSVSTAWKQLLSNAKKLEQQAYDAAKTSGDLQEGEEISLSKKEKKIEVEPGIDYREEILHFERKEMQVEKGQLNQRVEQIMIELRQLSGSVKQLEVQVRDVDMNVMPITPGKYHETFFEYLLAMLRNARTRIEDSSNWLGIVSKKASKRGYWGNAKKHGTSYTLSGERVVAQQVG
jgi:hypothetical protein